MGKIVFIWSVLILFLSANRDEQAIQNLEINCLSCHVQQQIPSQLIYRRYLMKYSTDKRIEEAIFTYFRHPKKENSIMPPQFFLKFPMKEKLQLDDTLLRTNIREYLKKFDIREHIIIKNNIK